MKIELKNVTKYYEKKILDNLNLSINDVQSVGVIGRSGCGKSTLLRQLSGMELADKGEIVINDIKINRENIKSYQSDIGYVFQKHNLFPHLSLRDNITLILNKVKKIDKNKANIITDELLKKVHLYEEADKKPNRVSGGQVQRAAIARALSTDPSIIFLDEPTAALDPILTGEVLNTIQELKDSGKDFIFVTHEISFLKEFADYVIFMDEGKIIEHGQIECLKKPKTKLLNDFLEKVK